MDPVRQLTHFLRQHYHLEQPLLLALSGGADSLCLFYALLEVQKQLPVKFHVAHVDHGWRSESASEAEALKSLVDSHSIPYHFRILDPALIQGNVEDYCRNQRILFFKELCQAYGLKGVLLGHHGDDQAETVLKRLFEGASLGRLAGLQPVSRLDGVVLLRPFLNLSKQEIIAWLQARDLVPFEDYTNNDDKFLRARMRSTMIPWLSEAFGKKVSDPLRHLGTEALEWRDYLDSKIEPYGQQIVYGPVGMYLDLSNQMPTALLELKALVRLFCEKGGVLPSRQIVDDAAGAISCGAANKQFPLSNQILHVDRQRLFLVSGKPELKWEMTTKLVSNNEVVIATSWQGAWQGQACVVLPRGNYEIGQPTLKAAYGPSSLDRWWTANGIPAFLRNQLPVVWEGEQIRHEFLTGRQLYREEGEAVLIVLKLIK